MLDTTLRAAALLAVAEVAPILTGDTDDALAGGLMAMFSLATAALVVALLDGIRQRDRLRLCLLWAVVASVVSLYEIAADLWRSTHGPGSYPSLEIAWTIERADLLGTFVFFALFVAVPAAVGLGLGAVIRMCSRATSRSLDAHASAGGTR